MPEWLNCNAPVRPRPRAIQSFSRTACNTVNHETRCNTEGRIHRLRFDSPSLGEYVDDEADVRFWPLAAAEIGVSRGSFWG